MTRSVALLEREYGNRLEKGRQEAAHYRLQPGLALQPDPGGDGGVMVALRPLMAMRLNRPAFGLLSALSGNGARADAAALAAGMPAADAEAFCDRLVRRRILARTPPVPAVWPSVSIIVAAHGRHAATRACITSLLALDYPGGPCEIIVVDDASEPPLAPALDGLPIRLIRVEQNIGQSAARNRAAADAQGDLLAFIDNDCVAEPDWLRALVPHFADPGVAIVGGRVVAPAQRGRIAAFEAVRSPLDMGRMDAAVGPDEAIAYLPTCNLVVRRDALLAAGGFRADMRVGEDVDFTWRVLRTGAAARYVPAGRVIHHHRTRPGALLRRRADYGSSEADLQRRHPGHRRMMPMPRVCLLLLAALTLLPQAWPAAAILLALSAALLLAETIGKRRRLRRLGVPQLGWRIAAAVQREHLASLHGLSANLVRYYGVPLLAAAVLWPALLPAAAVLLLAAPVIDHRRLRPACGLVPFVGLYWLEMAAYQAGVWRGCLGRRTLRPLLPILNWRR
ncbi:MAG: mycofactocin biosynthesis glycosyltransferase MftF [Rhodospirillales bacterium]